MYLHRYLPVFVLTILALPVKAQDTTNAQPEVYYKIAGGIGWGNTQHTEWQDAGPMFSLEGGIERNRVNYLLGFRSLSEFQLFDNANVVSGINSLEVKVGKVFGKRRLTGEMNAGIAFVRGRIRGDALSSDGGLFGNVYYQKFTYNAVGFPISLKGYLTPDKVGIGLDLYANLNGSNSFYAISFTVQFRPKKHE